MVIEFVRSRPIGSKWTYYISVPCCLLLHHHLACHNNGIASAFSNTVPHHLPILPSARGNHHHKPKPILAQNNNHPRAATSKLFDISYSASSSSNSGWGSINTNGETIQDGDSDNGTDSSAWGMSTAEGEEDGTPLLPKGFTFADDDDLNNGAWPYDDAANSNHAICAPEVNKWTMLMTDGTNAAMHRPGKEMTLEEGMEILYNDLKDLSEYDNAMIEQYWDQLLPTVSYLGTAKVLQVKQALRVAYRAHRSQMRKSGDPYIIHPVEVGLLLSGMKMDAETVMAGLLHDTVEDTDLTFEQVEAMFGQEVKSIVEGETKVSKLPKLAFADYADEQAENLRQMFIAMTDDYRIIIVKLADRLHNMRTLRHMKPEKQKKISRETLDIFAPLAHRMGIWNFKSELEDTAFMYLYPEEYNLLNQRLSERQAQFEETLNESITVLKRTLKNDSTLQGQDVDIEVVGRTKELYSLWHKMEVKGDRNLDNITDLVALRVILTPGTKMGEGQGADSGVWLCYHVLGLVQHLPGFQPMPTKVKDYISFPKPNGYQSLHTALIYKGQSVEVQIRTTYMHKIAEYGMASHWSYKDEKKRPTSLYNTPWLSSIKEWQQDMVCSRDFVDCVRRELLGKRVFVFLRNGKILNLARGATAVDAAFQIHTEVGLQMHGAEINGKPVPISYELKNGDVVSILTGDGKPTIEWMRFAKSRSTRAKLRAYFREKQNESFRKSGEMLFFDYIYHHQEEILGSSYLEYAFDLPSNTEELATFLPGRSRYHDVDELLTDIGRTHDSDFLRQKLSKIFLVPFSLLQASDESRFANITRTVYAAQADMNNVSLSIANDKMNLSFADVLSGGEVEYADVECMCQQCLPVRGDTILGTKNKSADHTIVHRLECGYAQEVLNNAKSNMIVNGGAEDEYYNDDESDSMGSMRGNRMRSRSRISSSKALRPSKDEIPVQLVWSEIEDSWEVEGNSENFLTEVVVVANDRKLLLADCSVVASKNSEILKTGSSSSSEHCVLEFLVRVRDLDELQNLMDRLREVNNVMSVERRFGSELFEIM